MMCDALAVVPKYSSLFTVQHGGCLDCLAHKRHLEHYLLSVIHCRFTCLHGLTAIAPTLATTSRGFSNRFYEPRFVWAFTEQRKEGDSSKKDRSLLDNNVS